MKISILGTRGIPNNYGGFEQFAENVSQQFVKHGLDVTVYGTSSHLYKNKSYQDITIKHISCYENILGSASQFLYDYLCLKDAVKNRPDIIIMCGYGSSAPALLLVNRKKIKIITNMDGFEWKRDKYNFITKKLLKIFERIAVSKSDVVLADHRIIQEYFSEKYPCKPALISYGATIPQDFSQASLQNFNLTPYNYYITIGRYEPENQAGLIIKAWEESGSKLDLCVVTNNDEIITRYSQNSRIRFIRGLYDYSTLSDLRRFSMACIHGHTVGGTNPSLLEAMASQAFIIAHGNDFNKSILEGNALFFDSADELKSILAKPVTGDTFKETSIKNNLQKILDEYNWENVANEYISLFKELKGKD